jgi:hypothetical protein
MMARVSKASCSLHRQYTGKKVLNKIYAATYTRPSQSLPIKCCRRRPGGGMASFYATPAVSGKRQIQYPSSVQPWWVAIRCSASLARMGYNAPCKRSMRQERAALLANVGNLLAQPRA